MSFPDIEAAMFSQMLVWGPKLGMALIIALLFWLAMILLRKAIYKISANFGLDIHVTALLIRTVRVTIVIFAAVTVLGTLGVDITAMVAGLGLTGFALGFALKDTISNLLAGVLILLYRPFSVGNNIKIAGYRGTVMSIDLRYTILEAEGEKVLIPNAKLFTDPVTVFSG